MSLIPGGTFWMGSEDFYPEEKPVHQVTVDEFHMDTTAVTVSEFDRFVTATGYVTTAEIAPDPADYPGADPSLLVPGSLVFQSTPGPVPLNDLTRWWSFVPGADWRHPEGPTSTVQGRAHHPVTQVSYFDALAYAMWAGKDLPTEAEWEFAARGGLDRKSYVWGDEHPPAGAPAANVWQGRFPWENLLEDGYERTAPVGSYQPNGYGLSDMAGNVWEWTSDHYTVDHAHAGKNVVPTHSCCIPHNPRSTAPATTGYAQRVIKGGSHLCAPNYCLRYRPAARQGESEESATCHVGFRCVVRAGS
ncbi:formylglycine-generating enzyme family protein [Rhodococcus sp. 27YEA15]|uniref:formylglycine-generating enzyme family protein n=1 Tax=Rhodococcus sp. 27YEA15 TaxID=3156259 RepID=UPI003C7C0376